MKQFGKEYGLRPDTLKRLVMASKRRRDYDLVDDPKERPFLVQTYRRKQPCNKINTPSLRAAFKHWLLNECSQITNSCNRKDQVNARDDETKKELKDEDGKKIKIGKQYWNASLFSLYQEATKEPSKGGFAGFRDKDGNIICKQITMERMMPHYFSRLTENHREDCICTDCQNGGFCHTDIKKWASGHSGAQGLAG